MGRPMPGGLQKMHDDATGKGQGSNAGDRRGVAQ